MTLIDYIKKEQRLAPSSVDIATMEVGLEDALAD